MKAVKVQVRITRRKRNAAGFNLTFGRERFWFRTKREAAVALLRILDGLRVSIQPVTRRRTQTPSGWLSDSSHSS